MGEGLGTNPLVVQALAVMMETGKSHLQRAGVGAGVPLHLNIDKRIVNFSI